MFYSKVLYIYYDPGTGLNWGATNLAILSRKSGISMGRLKYTFEKKKLPSKVFDGRVILRLRSERIYKKEVGDRGFMR